jgi:choline dehydrogenase-like flavoprotein
MATNAHEFDYIIIGGGTAGLVVAARLAEIPTLSILVLEAGESYLEDPRVRMPTGWTALLESEADWVFKTKPQVSYRNCSHECTVWLKD